MGKFVQDTGSVFSEHEYMSLPYQGRLEVFRRCPHGLFEMVLSVGSNEFTWLLDSITMPTAKREAMVKMKRWFATCIVEFDYNLEI